MHEPRWTRSFQFFLWDLVKVVVTTTLTTSLSSYSLMASPGKYHRNVCKLLILKKNSPKMTSLIMVASRNRNNFCLIKTDPKLETFNLTESQTVRNERVMCCFNWMYKSGFNWIQISTQSVKFMPHHHQN